MAQEINHVSDYRKRRRAEYPAIEDQLDALWKGGKDADDMKRKVEAVKARFPKEGRQKK